MGRNKELLNIMLKRKNHIKLCPKQPFLPNEPIEKFNLKTSITTNFLISFVTTILMLVMGEIAFRIYESRQPSSVITEDRPKYIYTPSREEADLKHFLAGGTRDYLYDLNKPPHTFRIAAIGDSFTYPPGMQFDDSYPKRLERMLNLNIASNSQEQKKVEVINFGRWGSSTEYEANSLRKILEYKPDLILLEITLNDAALPNYSLEVRKVFHRLEISPTKNWLLYYWRSLGFVVKGFHNNKINQAYIDFHQNLFSNPVSWGRFALALSKIKEKADLAQVPVLAFIFPFIHYPFDERYPYHNVHQKIIAQLNKVNIPNTDLLPAFSGVKPERLILEPGKDVHPNEVAHRIVAESVYAWLEENKFIPEDFIIRNKFRRTNGKLHVIQNLTQ